MINKEDREKLIETLSKKFKNKEIYLIFDGAISHYTITMNNIKFFVTKDLIVLVNEDDKELHIDPFYVEDIKYKNNTIKIEMAGDYSIILDS